MTRHRIDWFLLCLLAVFLAAPRLFAAQATVGQSVETLTKTRKKAEAKKEEPKPPAKSVDAPRQSERPREADKRTRESERPRQADRYREDRARVDHNRLQERLHVRPDLAARQRALEHSRIEREKFRRHLEPPRFIPSHRRLLVKLYIVPTTYHYRRTVFYDAYGWQPPRYVYDFYPRYGLWDAMFLMFALHHAADDEYALMFYHHWHDHELQAWMTDADRLALRNEELRFRLAVLQQRLEEFEESGIAVNPYYVPPDAQDVALSPEVIAQLTK